LTSAGTGLSYHFMPHSLLTIATRGPGLVEITDKVRAFVAESGTGDGLLTVFVRHTSASLLIQENADPDVRRDLKAFFDRLVPEGMDFIIHDDEGPDDMPAHIKAALTAVSLSIPIIDGRMVLGTWQGIYLFEHRKAPHQRQIVLQILTDITRM
jgi:secondary thiamine-phosphate synthase enzyme